MRTTWTFHSAGQLVFGRNAAAKLGEIARRLGARRVFVVTDPILLKAGLVDPVHAPLSEAGVVVEVFSGGEPEPSLRAADAAIAAARDFRPDVVIGLGGGSNMDLAKITAVVLTHGGQPLDYAGDDKIPGPIMPLLCVPTTAGTGAEMSAAVRPHRHGQPDEGRRPQQLSSPTAAAIVDPLLTVSCPPKVTADSGIDALTHAIEAYTAVDNADFPLPPGERSVYQGRHPFGDMLAERAVRLIAANPAAGGARRHRSGGARRHGPRARRWPAWRFPTSASPWSMRWNIPSAARRTARTAPAMVSFCPTSCAITLRRGLRRSHRLPACWAKT